MLFLYTAVIAPLVIVLFVAGVRGVVHDERITRYGAVAHDFGGFTACTLGACALILAPVTADSVAGAVRTVTGSAGPNGTIGVILSAISIACVIATGNAGRAVRNNARPSSAAARAKLALYATITGFSSAAAACALAPTLHA